VKRPITPLIGTLCLVTVGLAGVPLMWATGMRVTTGDWIYAGLCLFLGALIVLAYWIRRRRIAACGVERPVAQSPEKRNIFREMATRRKGVVQLIAEKHKARLHLEAVHREQDPALARVAQYEAALKEAEERVEVAKREMMALEERSQQLMRRDESERFSGDLRRVALHLLEERDLKINEILWDARLDVPFARIEELFPELVEMMETAKRTGDDALRAKCERELASAAHSQMETWKRAALELGVRKKAIQDEYATKLADLTKH
jgi:hypothetical protein